MDTDFINVPLITSACIDRAAEKALLTIPLERRKQVAASLIKIKASVLSPEIPDLIISATAENDDKIKGDESGLAFMSEFTNEVARYLTQCMIYFKRNKEGGKADRDMILEKAINSMCLGMTEFDDSDPDPDSYMPFDPDMDYAPAEGVAPEFWHCVALQSITIDETLRRTNGMCNMPDVIFYRRMAEFL